VESILNQELSPAVFEARRLVIDASLARFTALRVIEPHDAADIAALICLASTGSMEAAVCLARCGLQHEFSIPIDGKLALFIATGRLLGMEDASLVALRTVLAARCGDSGCLSRVQQAKDRCEALLVDLTVERSRFSSVVDDVAGRLVNSIPPGLSLARHQLEAVAFAGEAHHRMMLADDMGLGKTISLLATLLDIGLQAFPVLVVCPASMVGTWVVEARKWLSSMKPHIVVLGAEHDVMPRAPVISAERLAGMRPDEVRAEIERLRLVDEDRVCAARTRIDQEVARAAGGALFLIISWGQVVAMQRSIGFFKPKTIVGDESHYMKNLEAQRSRAMLRIRTIAPYRFLLSGTPPPNGRAKELFCQLRFLDEGLVDEKFGTYARKFCDPTLKHRRGGKIIVTYDGSSDEADLTRTKRRVWLERKKSSLDIGLPSKTRIVVPVDLDQRDILALAACKDEVKAKVLSRARDLEDRLRGEDKHSEEVIKDRVEAVLGSEALVALGALRILTGLIKVRAVRSLLEDLKDEGHTPVLYAEHGEVRQEAVRICQDVFGGIVLTGDGSMPKKKRTQLVERFQAGKATSAVLTGAFCEGVTLTRSARIVMLERFWIPGIEAQIEDRIHRIGQDQDVVIYYPHAAGTVDDVSTRVLTWKDDNLSRMEGSFQRRVFQWLKM
jgi:SWI/SNF-related matrix-associated actin-dependent regulator 1 of chromatin subfamily A